MVFLLFSFLIIFTFCDQYDTSGFVYKQKIQITPISGYIGTDLIDILLEINTQKMVVSYGMMKDCSDLAFVRQDTGELISHYIETSCNKTNTRIYLSMNISTISEDNTVDMFFKHENMESVAEEFDGNFIEINPNGCGSGWEYDTEFEGKFPFIDSTKSGQSSSSSSLDHSHFLIYFSSEVNDSSTFQESDPEGITSQESTTTTHTHVLVDDCSEVKQTETLPRYKEMYFCKSNKNDLSKGSIGLFKDVSDFSTSYSDYANEYLSDDEKDYGRRFFFGGKNGDTGGSDYHSHSIDGKTVHHTNSKIFMSTTTVFSGYNVTDSDGCELQSLKFDFDLVSSADHIHEVRGTCSTSSNIPTNYINFLLGVNNIQDNALEDTIDDDQMFYLSESVPPKGFNKNLEYDGFFLYSGDSFKENGIKGTNKLNHVHEFNIELIESSDEGFDANILHDQYYDTDLYASSCNSNEFGPPHDRETVYQYSGTIFADSGFTGTKKEHVHPTSSYTETTTHEIPVQYFTLLTRKPKVIDFVVDDFIEPIGTDFERDQEEEKEEEKEEQNCDPPCINGLCVEVENNDLNSTEISYVCNCTVQFEGEDCSIFIESATTTPFDPTFLVALGVTICVLIVLGVLIIAIVICVISGIILKRKRNNEYSKKMIDSLVNGIDKEQELQSQKEKLEEDKIKLETDKQKLEAEKKKEQEEKEQLKKDLEKLKLEKEKIAKEQKIQNSLKIIKKNEIKDIKKLLGFKNGYETYKGKYKGENIMYRLFKEDVFKKTMNFIPLNLIEMEISQYASYSHPNIITYQAIHLNPQVGVVSEFPENGSLINYFKKRNRKRFTFLQKVRIFYELANAIQYIHKQGKKNGDIRAENCFLTKEIRPKMDFGFNKTFDKEHIYSQYCAPELIIPQDDSDFEEDEDDDIEDSPSLKSDIYAFGILMFEIVSEDFNLYKVPKGKKEKIGEKVANDLNFRPKIGKLAKYYPNWFINLIKMCWNHEKQTRPSITRIKMIIETIVFEDNNEE